MKRLLITTLICAAASGVFAQNNQTDSAKTSKDTTQTDKNGDFDIHYGNGNSSDDSGHHYHNHYHNYPKPYIGITFARFDLGYTTLIDNGSFTLSSKNQFLDYNQAKTSNVGFDVFQLGVKVNKNFKVYLSGGFDWTLIRLRQNITILPSQPTLTYVPDTTHLHKNRFSSSYLRIPLSFDFHTDEDHHGNKFHFVIGPEAGLLLNGMVKQVSNEFGKQKIDNGYHFAKVRYGGFFRIGYGGWGVFAKYYWNDMFENSPDQQGLKNFSFGMTFGF